MAGPEGYPQPPPMYVPPGMPTPAPAGKRYLLHAGSVLRIVGVVLGGIALIWLGVWLPTLMSTIITTNPFDTLGSIIILAGVSVIFTGIGWSMQTWARGM